MKLLSIATVLVLFMYQIWKGSCAPSWNNGPINFGHRLDRLLPGPERRTTITNKLKSGPTRGSWIYIMGHPGNKRSGMSSLQEPVVLSDDIEDILTDRTQAIRLLHGFLQYIQRKGSEYATAPNDLDIGKDSKGFTPN